MDSSIIIKQSGIEFGTSGARGLVISFTNEVCFAFTLAFINTQEDVKRIAIAIDNRPSSAAMAGACISAAKSVGVEVEYYGVLPTPALAFSAQCAKIPAIMVTGSHIPFDRNGLKFYTKQGEITKQDEAAILASSAEVGEIDLQPLPLVDQAAFDSYINRYLSVFPSNLLSNKRIGIYQHSSAGRELYPQLFSELGAEVVCLGYSDEFVPIDTEAVAEPDREQAKKWAVEFNLDAIFSTDGDGDRPLLADENGVYFTGDILCMLAARSLGVEAVAVPVSCTTSIEATHSFKKVTRTKIGSPYVIEAFGELTREFNAVAGFEANGGFLLASSIFIDGNELLALPTRDALLPVLAVLKLAESIPLSKLYKGLPSRVTFSDRLKNIERAVSNSIIENGKLNPNKLIEELSLTFLNLDSYDETDGLRLTFTSKDVVHLRPSGNAPELRCYTESTTLAKAKQLCEITLGSISSRIT
ncbi:phosphomannomutase [Pseudoalteromonas sp. C12FD-1]|uniref:phosphomannomutase n=1 Tax=Pseudoalteromonas sp. C12FD-1 TaxID=3131979 RepID=UPI00307CEF98